MRKGILENRIVIIGGDHHNTLAVIRDLGAHNCDISILIHGKFSSVKDIRVAYSRYARKRVHFVAESENEIFEWLMSNYVHSERKTIIFPCSDLAAFSIDVHYEELSQHYLLPGFTGQGGKVAYLMDKLHQKELADQYGIPMAKTWNLSLEDVEFAIPADMVYPCIIKPQISALGSKADIRICKDKRMLETMLSQLSDMGYKNVLIQQFLRKKYEVCAYGCIIDGLM